MVLTINDLSFYAFIRFFKDHRRAYLDRFIAPRIKLRKRRKSIQKGYYLLLYKILCLLISGVRVISADEDASYDPRTPSLNFLSF